MFPLFYLADITCPLPLNSISSIARFSSLQLGDFDPLATLNSRKQSFPFTHMKSTLVFLLLHAAAVSSSPSSILPEGSVIVQEAPSTISPPIISPFSIQNSSFPIGKSNPETCEGQSDPTLADDLDVQKMMGR